MEAFILFFIFVTAIFFINNHNFKKTTYYHDTHNSYLGTIFDKGRHGEFLTYQGLKHHEKTGGKFLFNCYLPKDNGETTEIDVILINKCGVFVFESKNYSGWIFGNERSKTWTQTLPQGRGKSRKEHFLNPIMQNKLHIKWLQNLIGNNIAIHSIIVFSERCTLKKVEYTSPNIYVIKRNTIASLINKICNEQPDSLSDSEISYIYNQLYPYTQVEQVVKDQHIDNIKEKTRAAKLSEHSNKTTNAILPDGSGANTYSPTSINKICPRCGNPLVLRTAKSGTHAGEQFYGCSTFPKCRYRKNI